MLKRLSSELYGRLFLFSRRNLFGRKVENSFNPVQYIIYGLFQSIYFKHAYKFVVYFVSFL